MTGGAPPETEAGLRRRMALGALWAVGMRWTIRAIGLVSTIILARLLTPADFGIVGMAMLVVGLIEAFGDTGQVLALLRYRDPTRDHYDAAFTIGLVVSFGLGIAVVAVAPLAAWVFAEPRVEPVMQVLSLRVFADGFQNIGIVAFRREFRFAEDFRFLVYRKLLTFGAGLIGALALGNYWALVAGIVIGEVASVVSSYVMHPYRPRVSFTRARELWSVSGWLLLGSIANFIHERGDEYVVGAVAPTGRFGEYHVAADVANLPAAEIVLPLARGLFPAYARLAEQPKELRDAYLNVLSIIAVVCCSTAAGAAVIADDLVAVVLGGQWSGSGPLLAWLALHAACVGFANSAMPIHQAAGQAQLFARHGWFRIALALPAMALVGWLTHDVVDIAISRAAVSLVMIPIILSALPRAIPVTARDVLSVTIRPLLAALVMLAATVPLHAALPFSAPIARLAVTIPAGAAVFFATMMLSWLLAGRPPGPERAGLRWLSLRLARAG